MIQDDSNRLPVNTDILIRFFSKICTHPDVWFRGTQCWIWTASRDWKGYAQFGYRWRQWHGRGHQIAFKMFVGTVPEGLQLDHLCRRPSCVNPTHLEPVTSWENSLRGNSIMAIHVRQTHCKYGHEFTPENTYIMSQGGRQCRICRRNQNNDWHHRN